MAELNTRAPVAQTPTSTEEAQINEKHLSRAYVDASAKLEDVLNLDAEGVELIFESDKGKFFHMEEDAIRALHHENRVRYSMAAALNAKHDPDMDGFGAKFSVGEYRDNRAKTKSQYEHLPQSADALATLTAYAGSGYHGRWVSREKVEYWKRKGLDFVKAGEDGNPVDATAFVQAPVNGGVFSTRVRSGVDELIYMREPIENQKKRKAVLQDKADRQASILKATPAGMQEMPDQQNGPAFVDR